MHEMRSLPQSSLPTPHTPLVGHEQEIAVVCAPGHDDRDRRRRQNTPGLGGGTGGEFRLR
jgi:hypothetical protein